MMPEMDEKDSPAMGKNTFWVLRNIPVRLQTAKNFCRNPD
jgi:hypothetical protein